MNKLLNFIILTLILTVNLYSVSINGDNTTYSRFSGGYPSTPTNNPTFWAKDFDLSGIGWDASGGKSFILISPRHVAFATHYLNGVGSTIYFKGTDGIIRTRTIQANTTANGDLTIVTLDSPFTSSDNVNYFPVIKLTNGAAANGWPLYVYGNTAKMSSSNTINLFSPTWNGSWGFFFNNSSPGQGLTVVGDSGSPAIIPIGDILTAAAVHSVGGGSTSIGYYWTEVNSILGATGYSLEEIETYNGNVGLTNGIKVVTSNQILSNLNTTSLIKYNITSNYLMNITKSLTYTNGSVTGKGTLRCGTIVISNGIMRMGID